MTAGMSWDLSKCQESVAHVSVSLLHLTVGQQNVRSESCLRIQFSLTKFFVHIPVVKSVWAPMVVSSFLVYILLA